jgi:hypothetical protein
VTSITGTNVEKSFSSTAGRRGVELVAPLQTQDAHDLDLGWGWSPGAWWCSADVSSWQSRQHVAEDSSHTVADGVDERIQVNGHVTSPKIVTDTWKIRNITRPRQSTHLVRLM